MSKKRQQKNIPRMQWLKRHWKPCICGLALFFIVLGITAGASYRVHQHNVEHARIEQAERVSHNPHSSLITSKTPAQAKKPRK